MTIDEISPPLYHFYGFFMNLVCGDIGVVIKRFVTAVDDPHQPDGSIASYRDLIDYARLHAFTFAARNVFSIRVAIVIGPTPPGTGVIADAISLTFA